MRILKQANAAAIPRVLANLCRGCPRCAARAACESKAVVVVDPGEPAWIDASRCFACRSCILACPFGAIVLESQEEDARASTLQ